MILLQDNINDDGVNVSKVAEFNKEIEDEARNKFNKLKDKNIIINSIFDDCIWKITNEYKTTTFNFAFNEILYQQELEKREMLTYQQFVNAVKSYCILRINNFTPWTIGNFLFKLKEFMENTHYLNLKYSEKRLENINNIRITEFSIIKDFIDFIESDSIDEYRELLIEDLECLDNTVNNATLNRRTLTDFQSIFLFDKLIKKFWEEEATEEDKTLYYPIYLWWSITNILPLRVTEFLLTPYDCIGRDSKGNYTLSVRRSNLKGNSYTKYKNKVTHNIDNDYRICTYPIPEKIVYDIENYKKKTKGNKRTLLMSLEHYLNKDIKEIDRYNITMLPRDLNDLLLKFFSNVLNNKKGIKIVDNAYLEDKFNNMLNESTLSNNEIKLLKAGDTRHFAMINMILNDFNPILIKDFAGHTNINTSYHYFGNISEVVKCISYNKYQELSQFNKENLIYEDNNITPDKILLNMNKENKFTTEVDYGICLSEKFFNGNLDDCKSVAADCDVCNFFKRTVKETAESRKLKLDKYEENIRREGKLLANLLRNTTNDNKIKEIGECVLKIQGNATRYIKKFNDGGYCDDK